MNTLQWPCCCEIETIKVLGCATATYPLGAPLSGATVTIKDGGGTTLFTGTTDSTGTVTWPGGTGGTSYTVGITAAPRFAAHAASAFTYPGTLTFTLSPATGYSCCSRPDPIKSTLNCSNSQGTFTISRSGTAGYIGSQTVSYANGTTTASNCVATSVAVTAVITWTIGCEDCAAGSWSWSAQGNFGCEGTGARAGYPQDDDGFNFAPGSASGTGTVGPCPALSMTIPAPNFQATVASLGGTVITLGDIFGMGTTTITE